MKPQKLIKISSPLSDGAACKRRVALARLLVACLALAGCLQLAAAASDDQLTVESREQKQELTSELEDPIKYLERLDKFYSQMARPRFGRSVQNTKPSSRLAALQLRNDWLARNALLRAALARQQQQVQRANFAADNNYWLEY